MARFWYIWKATIPNFVFMIKQLGRYFDLYMEWNRAICVLWLIFPCSRFIYL